MAKLFTNSADPDQTPHSAASDLGLHCLPITLLRVSRLQWVTAYLNEIFFSKTIAYTFYKLYFVRVTMCSCSKNLDCNAGKGK